MNTIRAVEYNAWMSILTHISNSIPTYAGVYSISGVDIDVIPAYPKDLTKFRKPSIIVQRVHGRTRSIGFGNVAGLYEDADSIRDVYGKLHELSYQINVDARSNHECSLIASMLAESIIDHDVPLLDHLVSGQNPVEVGTIQLDDNIQHTIMSSNENRDYIETLLVDMTVVQTTIDMTQDVVDLSKPISWRQTIRL